MPDEPTILRILIACPADVENERTIVHEVVDDFNATWSDHLGVRYDAIGWRTHTHPDVGSDPQAVINAQLPDYKVFVGILWTRFGTPTPRAGSGTEEEFERAYARYIEDPANIAIMLYFSDVQLAPSSIDEHQSSLVKQFRTRVSAHSLYSSYSTHDEFRGLVRRHLAQLAQQWKLTWGPGTSGPRIDLEEATSKASVEASPQAPKREDIRPPSPWTADEEHVRVHSVSQDLKEEFARNFAKDRENAATVQTLFDRAGAFTREGEYETDNTAGFSMRVWKGPFVRGSNWLEYRTWEFALGMERHLLARLATLLRQSAEERQARELIRREWHPILEQVDRLVRIAKSDGCAPSAVVLTGPANSTFRADSWRLIVPDWELPDEINKPWILGSHNELPILEIETDQTALYVVDIARFASLTKHLPEFEFSLEEFSKVRALEMIASNPNIVRLAQDEAPTTENKLRRLQLEVGLRLYESFQLNLKEPRAVYSASIDPGN